MKKHRMLIIRACGMASEKDECDNIKTQATLYGIEVVDKNPKSSEELNSIFTECENPFDFIYLSAHGDATGFCHESNTMEMRWGDLAYAICSKRCMNTHGILLLSCCRGGLNQIAYTLFFGCPEIDYIVGPRTNLTSQQMLICYNIFLFNVVCLGSDPVIAAEKVKAGCDIRLKCFDRIETTEEDGFQNWVFRAEGRTYQEIITENYLLENNE